jgi:AcrR family transcriptional regulator
MTAPLRTPGRRQPQARSLANDARVLAATEALLADTGWGNLSRRAIARSAGTSEQVVRDRTADAADLALLLWRDRLGPLAIERLAAFLAAVTTPHDAPRTAAAHAWAPFVEPDPAWRAIGELLIVAHYHPNVRAAVDADLGASLARWCAAEPDPIRAAQHCFALARALGLVLHGRFAATTAEEFTPLAAEFDAMIQNPGEADPLPDERADHLDHLFPFDTGDAVLDATLRGIFEEVGSVGYDQAVLMRVAERAGTNLGVVYRKFGSKSGVFQAATAAQRRASLDVNLAFRERLTKRHGPGIAEALFIREFLRPGRHLQRTIDLEQLRLAWHDPTLHALTRSETQALVERTAAAHPSAPIGLVRASIQAGRATGTGFVLLADLLPDAWRLPFHVLTIPMYAPATNGS